MAGIAIKDVMGNPMDSISPYLSQVRWLFGTVFGWVFLLILVCIAIGIVKYALGSMTSSAQNRQEGKAVIIEIVAIVFIGIVSTGVIVFLFNTYIFA
jgi:hypothetical protein